MFGLISVNFLPPNNLPNIKPPTSVDIHINIKKIKVIVPFLLKGIKKFHIIRENIERYMTLDKKEKKYRLIFFLKNIFK